MTSLVLDEKIQTTEAKAKSIKSQVEKLVTKAKKREAEAGRFLSAHLMPDAVDKVINRIAPQFKSRPGGYTRIVRLGNRVSDSASMVVMEWVETIQKESSLPKKTVKRKSVKTAAPKRLVKKAVAKSKPAVVKASAKPKAKKVSKAKK